MREIFFSHIFFAIFLLKHNIIMFQEKVKGKNVL